MQLFELNFLFGPIPRGCSGVDGMDIFVIFDQSLNGLGGQLEGDFILGNHVNVDDICFNGDHLVVKKSLDQGIVIFPEF